MACTSLHEETGRWLTSMGVDAAEGSEHTLSVGHPLFGGEFTTYRLGAPIAVNRYGEPMFDMDEASVSVERAIIWEVPTEWVPLREVRDAIDAAKSVYPCVLTIRGRSFKRGSFGLWSAVEGVGA